MYKVILIMLLAVINAGCATNTGIVKIADNTYMNYKLDRWEI